MTRQEQETLAKRVIRYRADHDISAVKFAKLCRVTPQTVYNIENCLQSPSKITLAKIEGVIIND